MMALSERISQTGALLRTQVNIQTETQNQQLLEKLTRGQELQLKLQHTVEGFIDCCNFVLCGQSAFVHNQSW